MDNTPGEMAVHTRDEVSGDDSEGSCLPAYSKML